MENLGEDYYNLGLNLFEGGYYKQAVEYLIRAYNIGFEKQQILENLYACFVYPNEEEYMNNFIHHREGITQISFEECTLDFIPVSENEFYIFDKEQGVFSGILELEKEPVQGEKGGFHSILFAGIWDIRKMLPRMKERKWSLAYIILDEQERKFVSFLKLPRFRELYLRDVAFFKDVNLMRDVFEQYAEFYLPKYIVGVGAEQHLESLREIHVQRIHGTEIMRNNIFLSICIPSYNRGTLALKNVNHLLQCLYDSEIEIIVSNNGSVKDVKGYEEISKLRDARLVYHEFEENQGFASNVLKTLELAKGKFAVLVSDEDLMILENMEEAFDRLKQNETCGVFLMGETGSFVSNLEDELYKAGMEAVNALIDMNYMTGMTYNMEIFRKLNVFDSIAKMRGNNFLEYYIHIPLALIIGQKADFYCMKLRLWDAGNAVVLKDAIPKYMLPWSRIMQQNSIMEFCQKGLEMEGVSLVITFLQRSLKTYFLLEVAYDVEKFRKAFGWEEICIFVYKEHLKYLKSFPIMLFGEMEKNVQNEVKGMFLRFLNSDKILSAYSKEEKEEKEEIHQGIQRKLEAGNSIAEVEMEGIRQGYLHEIGKNDVEPDIIDTFIRNVEN